MFLSRKLAREASTILEWPSAAIASTLVDHSTILTLTTTRAVNLHSFIISCNYILTHVKQF
jgi:hypothetical protein